MKDEGWMSFCNFCDAMYEGPSKTVILSWQKGRGFRKSPNLCDIIKGWPLIQFQMFKFSKTPWIFVYFLYQMQKEFLVLDLSLQNIKVHNPVLSVCLLKPWPPLGAILNWPCECQMEVERLNGQTVEFNRGRTEKTMFETSKLQWTKI